MKVLKEVDKHAGAGLPGLFSEEYVVRYYFKYLAPDGKIHQSKTMELSYYTEHKGGHDDVAEMFYNEFPYAHVIKVIYV